MMRLTLELMGTPQVQLDGAPVSFSRRAVLALLAYLVASEKDNSRQRFNRELLSALFWPEHDQTRALTNLRHTLWEVSNSIGREWIITQGEAIYLKPGAEIMLDVAQFHSLLKDASGGSDPLLRIPLLEEAVRLYRGPFMAGFTLKGAADFNEWVSQKAEDLRRAMISTLTRLIEDYRRINQARAAIPYAQRLVTLDPLDEAGHRQLMHMYALTDQPAAALRSYQALEKLLRKELNLDPQPETRELHKRIRRGEFHPVDHQNQPEAFLQKHNLPLHLTTFVGREKEKEEISRLLAQNSLVTLLGTGGIGKTRLALRVGQYLLDQYPEGLWFVPLDSLVEEERVPQRVASFLGVAESPGRSAVETLVSALRNSTMLLILDGCEHLREAVAQLVEAILSTCPGIRILATSREVLDVEGECLYAVPSLNVPAGENIQAVASLADNETLRLFIERSRLVSSGFAITNENLPFIIEICRRLDGIPLAIEFAAARVDMLSLKEILRQLDRSFDLLAGPKRSLSPRHHTLRASMNWSWNLLTDAERTLMRCLSVFVGGWTVGSAQAVCECEDVGMIGALVRKSLVVVDQEAPHETRYHFHNMVRKYALEKLVEAGEENTMRDRHLGYFLEMSRKFEPALRGVDQLSWLERLFVERDNIRAAMQWAAKTNLQAGLYLSGRLQAFWESYDLPEEKRWLLMI